MGIFTLWKNLTKRSYIFLGLIVVLIAGQVYFDLTIPDFVGSLANLPSTNPETSVIVLEGMKLLGCGLGSIVCTIAITFLSSAIGTELAYTLRKKCFNKVLSFSNYEINDFSIPSLVTRSTNDVVQVQNSTIMFFRLVLSAPAVLIGALIKTSVSIEPVLSVPIVVALACVVIFASLIVSVAFPKFKIIQKCVDKLNSEVREQITGVRNVRAFNAENYETQKFEKVNKKTTRVNTFVSRIMNASFPVIFFFMNVLVLSIYWIGMELLSDGKINSIGAIMSSVTLATIIFMSFLRLIMLLVIFPRSFVSARRINELLQKKMVIAKNGVEKVGKFEELEFKNVCFGYDKSQEYVLEDISFTVKRGETLAILGATGSGKSSILNLIPKFIEPSKGEILINNQNINNLEDNSLLGLIGYVPQKIFLMNQSIKNNVGYGKEITDEELEFFGSLADLNFVNNLENTYDYQVTQSGKNLSGGQKQRVAIARAIAVQPQLLLFDDSFSALDFITDKNIRENIKTNLKEATKIIVAQRIGTVMDADKILVIDKGKIVGSGTHQELIKTCQIYREIALSQLTQEEVENA